MRAGVRGWSGARRNTQLLKNDFSHRGTRLGETMSALSSPRSPISVCARPIWPGGESTSSRTRRKQRAVAPVPPREWSIRDGPLSTAPSTLALTSTARACEVARDRRVRAARRRPHWARRALVSASVRAPSVDAHHDARRVLAAVAPLPSRRHGRSARRSARAPLRAPSTPAASTRRAS